MGRQIKTPQVNGVGAGQTATIPLFAGGTYRDLMLFHTRAGVAATQAQMEAEIDEIRILLNGKVQQRWTVADLFKHNAFRGLPPADDGFIPILFSEPHRREINGEDAMAWSMGGISSFEVQVDFAAGATTPGLSCFPDWDPQTTGIGAILKTRHINQVPVAGTGLITVPNIDKNENYFGMHIKANNFDLVRVRMGGVEIVNIDPAILHKRQKAYGLVPQTGWTHLMADYNRRIFGILAIAPTKERPIAPSFELEFNMTSGTSFDIIALAIGKPD